MVEIKKSVLKGLKFVIGREVKKQEDSACFLLGYQPKYPVKKNSNRC